MDKNNKTNESNTSAVVVEEDKKSIVETIKGLFKKTGSKKIKNQAFFKRGSYSLIITVLVIAALIVFNVLLTVIAERVNLEIDMTGEKQHSMTQENIDYIKSINDEVTITMCSAEDSYVSALQYYYSNSVDADENYYEQTITLMKKYSNYNDKITVRFIDPQSEEFTQISQNPTYSSLGLSYGDIIVSYMQGEKERVKLLKYDDIYVMSEDNSSGYGYKTLSGNKLETALTSAISYVVSGDSKKAAILTGHSVDDYTAAYIQLLKENNYEVDTISDAIITEISSDYDIIAIISPSVDFIGSEIDVISDFLDNDGNLDKGLMYFGDSACPTLPTLNEFLLQWGIKAGEGTLFATESYISSAGNTTVNFYVNEEAEDSITTGISRTVSGYNVPLTVSDVSLDGVTATALMLTENDIVIAPAGETTGWSDYGDQTKSQYAGVIQSVKSNYDNDNNKRSSYVMAFSSVEIIHSVWSEYSTLSNKDIVLACTDRAAAVKDDGVKFTLKTIKSTDNFYTEVTNGSVTFVRVVFMIIVPIAVVVAGIYIFIRRKNAR